MRRPYRPNAKEVVAWETDPDTSADEEENEEAESESQKDNATEHPGTEEIAGIEGEINPMVFKAFIRQLEEYVKKTAEEDPRPELKGVIAVPMMEEESRLELPGAATESEKQVNKVEVLLDGGATHNVFYSPERPEGSIRGRSN